MKTILSLLLGLTFSVNAADTSPAIPTPPSWLTQAKQVIAEKKFNQAINLLSQASDKQSADWHNMMGFSLRKKSPPDLLGAENQYKLALTCPP
ncbi:MAG: hypothetical protein QE279_04840 [Rhodoferax sp.]|nr:hypothetical protein [Rhodoferax sp.]